MPELGENRFQKLQISGQQKATGTVHQLVVQQDQMINVRWPQEKLKETMKAMAKGQRILAGKAQIS